MNLEKRAQFIKVVSIILLIYSLLWGLAPYPSINFPARFILDISDWPLDKISQPLNKDIMWLSVISAGLLAAVSIFFYGIVAPAVKNHEKTIINTSIVAILFWYFIDSIGSIAAGVSSNVIFNTLYLILMIAPLVGIKQPD